ncbi:MAG TPA: hypothetical protein VGN57_02955 [Pirellulaceae bacterium]|jgi:hypothetical protein|nr:hypothetical protein [Pirellulaceae bacterium]
MSDSNEDQQYVERLQKVQESWESKVREIFQQTFGERSRAILGHQPFSDADRLLIDAHREDWGDLKAADIAFHMTDWKADAAAIVALHLFPEKFTPEEAQLLVQDFLIHAPSHIRAACVLTEWTKWTDFEMPHE